MRFYPGTVRVNSLIQLAVAVCSLGQSPVRCDESCCSLSATLHQCQSQERVCPKTELPKTCSNPKLTYSKPTWATCQRALAQVFLTTLNMEAQREQSCEHGNGHIKN